MPVAMTAFPAARAALAIFFPLFGPSSGLVLVVADLLHPLDGLAVFRDVRAVDMAKGLCLPARMLVKADEGWTDQQLSAALSLLEEKSSLPATAEKHVLCLVVL